VNRRGHVTVEEVRFERMLYRTAKGAFFVHFRETAKFMKGKPVDVPPIS